MSAVVRCLQGFVVICLDALTIKGSFRSFAAWQTNQPQVRTSVCGLALLLISAPTEEGP